MSSKRHRKEAFVSFNDGTTFFEVSAVAGVMPLGVAARRALDAFASGMKTTTGKRGVSSEGRPLRFKWTVSTIAKDFVLVVMPAVVAMLAPATAVVLILAAGVGCVVVVVVVVVVRMIRRGGGGDEDDDDDDEDDGGEASIRPEPLGALGVDAAGAPRPHLAVYRATMTLTTAVAILAVDFPAFPRRLGKTETHGVGLMDVGSGSFVLANAIVCRRARTCGLRADPAGAVPGGFLRTTTRVAPLLALAVIRGVTTHAADYQVPVGEYGRHWNFFASLAAVTLLAAVLPVTPRYGATAGVLLLSAHQLALSGPLLAPLGVGPLGPYLARHERGSGWVEQNKEGLGSIPGYFALYLLGLGLGHLLERSLVAAAAGEAAGKQRAMGKHPKKEAVEVAAVTPCGGTGRWHWAWSWLMRMTVLDAWFWAAALLTHRYVEPVSRRTANAAYCLWMVAFNLMFILAYVAGSLMFPAVPPVPCLLAVVNRRLLPVFLVANLGTGAVNMLMDTMEARDVVAWGVMTVYLVGVCGVALGIDALLGGGAEPRCGVGKQPETSARDRNRSKTD